MKRAKLHQSNTENTKYSYQIANTDFLLCFEYIGQSLEISVSQLPGTEVPNATKAIAFTVSLRKMKHPKWEATSPITAVIMPMVMMETVKVI